VLLGLVAARDEPIAGGRHKVFGHHALSIIPQTSTIASHLPRALGLAFSLERGSRLAVSVAWPPDAVVVCSFGDASANHSTALGAINAACHTAYAGLPVPLLLVCEDNGVGISVPTPDGWIRHSFAGRLPYFDADGYDLASAVPVCAEAADFVRRKRRPAFLHLRTVRLMGHAGSDVEAAYRTPAEIAAAEERDPLLGTASLLIGSGVCTAADVVELYEQKRAEVVALADEVAGRPRLGSAAEVMAPLVSSTPDEVSSVARGIRVTEQPVVTLAQAINHALADVLDAFPEVMVFGEDVGRKGGVYGVTRGLARRFGARRVFDTLLDEQSILGLALGAGLAGLLPIPEIQYLAYLHNAEDQLRGEAATLRFFSAGQYRNPLVVRVAGYGYQKGFGGHFHNDNAVGVLRDVPGLVVASPSRPDDAAAMLRTCVAAARVDGVPCVFLEPIALYHQRDLHASGDDGWLAPLGPMDAPVGSARVHGSGSDLTMVAFGNGLWMSLRVARRLAGSGIGVRVVDLRWLAPLPVEDILREASATGRVLVVDETRRSGGVSEGVLAALIDGGFTGRMARVTSEDSFIPLGPAANHVLLSEPAIESAARNLLG
jgi:2-oxoisovalerate dehydrogenase E1 component